MDFTKNRIILNLPSFYITVAHSVERGFSRLSIHQNSMESSDNRKDIKRKKFSIEDSDVGTLEEIQSEYQEILRSVISISNEETSGKNKHGQQNPKTVLFSEVTVEDDKIICGHSNDQVKILDPERLVEVQLDTKSNLTCRHNGLSGVRCSRVNPAIFYTSSSKEGSIFQWDQRMTSFKPVQKYVIKSDAGFACGTKAILSFDVSLNDQVICGGTELADEDSYVLFWDIRSTRLLGAYWESHSDDITTVNFSPVNGNKLATGSTDGLLNIFDLRESTEDDALLFSFNSESSVDAVCWETGDLVAKFDREKVANSYKRSRKEAAYLQGSYRIDQKGSLGILVSSLAGNCARIVKLEENSLSPFCLFSDQVSLVQSATRFHKSNRWFTFDEGGESKIWEPVPSQSTLKASQPKKSKKSK
ncbi:unnamed protein product [Allacma fusca]|uniref:WD repeat-containing protein 89 n=1 Tax=Allacma fusca TaxID=39272 RepID=A0A8J2L355_9HEXA|nr:unnamed protein product [Allacma fusca]